MSTRSSCVLLCCREGERVGCGVLLGRGALIGRKTDRHSIVGIRVRSIGVGNVGIGHVRVGHVRVIRVVLLAADLRLATSTRFDDLTQPQEASKGGAGFHVRAGFPLACGRDQTRAVALAGHVRGRFAGHGEGDGQGLIPNAIGPVIVYVTLTVPKVILLESFLSFLGLGVQEPLTSWGVLISEGADMMQTSPWMLLVPSVFLALTLFCLNFLGDGLRDALDPKTR